LLRAALNLFRPVSGPVQDAEANHFAAIEEVRTRAREASDATGKLARSQNTIEAVPLAREALAKAEVLATEASRRWAESGAAELDCTAFEEVAARREALNQAELSAIGAQAAVPALEREVDRTRQALVQARRRLNETRAEYLFTREWLGHLVALRQLAPRVRDALFELSSFLVVMDPRMRADSSHVFRQHLARFPAMDDIAEEITELAAMLALPQPHQLQRRPYEIAEAAEQLARGGSNV